MNIKIALLVTIFLHVTCVSGAILSGKAIKDSDTGLNHFSENFQNDQDSVPTDNEIVDLRTIRTTRRTTRPIVPPSFSTTIRVNPPLQTTPNSTEIISLPPVFPPIINTTPSNNQPMNPQTTPSAATNRKFLSGLLLLPIVVATITRNI